MALKVTNAANGNPTLWIYGPIGKQFGGVVADDVRQVLQDLPLRQDIDIHIHSEGGDYREAIAIHTNLSARKGKKSVYVDSLAASAGSIIAMVGDTIEIADGGWIMIHEAQGTVEGRADDFRNAATMLDSINEQIRMAYSRRWKGSDKELQEAMRAETWYKPDTAISAGLADRSSGTMAIAAYVNPGVFNYAHVPAELSAERLPDKHKAYEEKLASALS